jgi:hypothetical protein
MGTIWRRGIRRRRQTKEEGDQGGREVNRDKGCIHENRIIKPIKNKKICVWMKK